MTTSAEEHEQQLAGAVALLRRELLLGPREAARCRLLEGGTVAVVVLVQAASGRRWVVKQLPGAPTGAAASEAEGLRALAGTRTLAVPRLHHHGPDGLVLEVLSSRPEDAEFYETLGRDLAAMQKVATSAQHGWAKDNHLGELPQRNGWFADGHAFFAEQRLLRYLREPQVCSTLGPPYVRAVERLSRRLPELVPAMPAVLLHGDFWAGNVLASPTGRPAVVDPAVWCGWAEVDVGMFLLSSRPRSSDAFLDSWQEAARPEPGWRERAPLLYARELLSGVAHFGGAQGYADRLRPVLRPFLDSHRTAPPRPPDLALPGPRPPQNDVTAKESPVRGAGPTGARRSR